MSARNPVDYFGLMAYFFVMYGGMPDPDLLWSEESRGTSKPKRNRSKLRVIEGAGRAREIRSRPAFDEAVA
jgi:hypothetical protein